MTRALGLRAEDLLLAAWNAGGVPLVATGGLAPILTLGDAPDPLAGAVQLLAVLAAIVAIATRPARGAGSGPAPLGNEASLGLIGPLVGGIAFVAGSASAYLGMGVDGLVVGVAFVVVVAAVVLGDRLPVVDAGLRRALILPFVLVAAGIFDAFAADILDGLEVGDLIAAATLDETGFGLFVLGMLAAGIGAFYAALVVAPRLLVDPQPAEGCLAWPLRFLVYLVSAALGIGWLAATAA